jgi:hypothetical protein
VNSALRAFLIALMLADTACSSSSPASLPASPSPANQSLELSNLSLAGIWTGFVRITDANDRPAVGLTLPFLLRVAGGPQAYSGEIEVQDATRYINVDVVGAIGDDGFAVLSGSREIGTWNLTAMDVPALVVRTDAVSGLTGTIRFRQRVSDSIVQYSASILSASLRVTGTSAVRPLEGRWTGRAIIRTCTGWCNGIYYAPTNTRPVELVLQQVGDQLSGRASFGTPFCGPAAVCWLPLTGSAAGLSVASLTGEFTNDNVPPGAGGDRVMKLSDFSATIDQLGRMQAQFTYSSVGEQWEINAVPPRLSQVSSRLALESLWLTREP